MADTPVLGTGEETREGSTPFIWTNFHTISRVKGLASNVIIIKRGFILTKN